MILAVGAPRNDASSGHVRIFELNNGAWLQLGGDIDGEATNDRFGFSVRVAISNDGNGVSNLDVSQCETGAILSICID
jgi:hypothetical protein